MEGNFPPVPSFPVSSSFLCMLQYAYYGSRFDTGERAGMYREVLG